MKSKNVLTMVVKAALVFSLVLMPISGLFEADISGRNPRTVEGVRSMGAPNYETIGGEKQDTDPDEYDWMVALLDKNESSGYDAQFCGGTLISAEWVLTAAHCVEDESVGSVNVAVGVTNLSSIGNDRVEIDAIVIHPGYDSNSLDDDIALIHLATPVTDHTALAIIDESTAALDDAGIISTVLGWGSFSENDQSYPDNLQESFVPIIDQRSCNFAYEGDIGDGMLCAGFDDGTVDSCYGDSGGPLVVSDGNGNFYQAGIVSWGDECGSPEFPGVYTRVTEYTSWINGYISGQASVPDQDDGSGPVVVVDDFETDDFFVDFEILSDEEFDALLDQIGGGGDFSELEIDSLTEEEFDALLYEGYFDELSDEDFYALLDQVFGEGDFEGDFLSDEEFDALLDEGYFDELSDEEFDALLDDIYGEVDFSSIGMDIQSDDEFLDLIDEGYFDELSDEEFDALLDEIYGVSEFDDFWGDDGYFDDFEDYEIDWDDDWYDDDFYDDFDDDWDDDWYDDDFYDDFEDDWDDDWYDDDFYDDFEDDWDDDDYYDDYD